MSQEILRDEIAKALFDVFDVAGLAVDLGNCTLVEAEVDLAAIADRILAIPKVATALAWHDLYVAEHGGPMPKSLLGSGSISSNTGGID